MKANGRGNRVARLCAALLLAICVAGALGVSMRPITAAADAGDLDAMKAHWQARYRKLRVDEARLLETVKLATKEYADSNRRNYRRSGVRHFHRTNANEAKKELASVQAQIETIFSDVVSAGGSVNWLYEVDDEPIDPNRVEGLGVYEDEGRFGGKGAYAPYEEEDNDTVEPAAGGGPDLSGDDGNGVEGDDGRNPLYSDDDAAADDDDPASPDEGGFGPYDYELWRTNRQDYERERAPERHLGGDDD
ncbi:MAG: hypothetical protein IPK00_27925 [Deltaproteobacteria bacterium]|nr:hypothetical protein [Deltaproteobacteria bacterium]